MPALQPQTIRASRGRLVGFLALCLLFVVIGVWMVAKPDIPTQRLQGWASVGFFGLGAVIDVALLLRPLTLRLDSDGFELSGGLIRTPRRVAWTAAERFRIYRLPRGGAVIGYDRPRDPLAEAPRGVVAGFLGVDGSLPAGWTLSRDKLVALLNDYRAEALGRR